MKPEKRLDKIDDAIQRLTFRIQDLARYAVRVDKDVEELALHIKKLRFPDDEHLRVSTQAATGFRSNSMSCAGPRGRGSRAIATGKH